MLPLLQQQYAWGFVCGRVSVLEGQLLSSGFFQNLLGQEKLDDMLRQLQGLPIEATMLPGMIWDHWTDALENHYRGMMMSLRKDSPSPAVVDFFLLSGEYFNLKQALLKRGAYPFPKVLLEEETLAAIEGGTSSPPDFVRAILEKAAPVERGGEEPLPLDLLVDAAYLQHLLDLARETGAPLIEAYAHELVLSKAVSLLWRARRLGVSLDPYQRALADVQINQNLIGSLAAAADLSTWPQIISGTQGALMAAALEAPEHRQAAVFEQLVAQDLVRLAQRGRMQVFGPERLFSFLAAIGLEVFNLKLVVSGRIKHVEIPAIRQELRVAHG